MEGRKDDQSKVRLELIPRMPLWALGKVLTFGAKKYEAWNWSKGMDWSRPYGAAMRHLTAWYDREEGDPETGFSHLWHAFCCVMFLIVYEDKKIGTDDRPVFEGTKTTLRPVNVGPTGTTIGDEGGREATALAAICKRYRGSEPNTGA